jgi:hypothetical protein
MKIKMILGNPVTWEGFEEDGLILLTSGKAQQGYLPRARFIEAHVLAQEHTIFSAVSNCSEVQKASLRLSLSGTDWMCLSCPSCPAFFFLHFAAIEGRAACMEMGLVNVVCITFFIRCL